MLKIQITRLRHYWGVCVCTCTSHVRDNERNLRWCNNDLISWLMQVHFVTEVLIVYLQNKRICYVKSITLYCSMSFAVSNVQFCDLFEQRLSSSVPWSAPGKTDVNHPGGSIWGRVCSVSRSRMSCDWRLSASPPINARLPKHGLGGSKHYASFRATTAHV